MCGYSLGIYGTAPLARVTHAGEDVTARWGGMQHRCTMGLWHITHITFQKESKGQLCNKRGKESKVRRGTEEKSWHKDRQGLILTR